MTSFRTHNLAEAVYQGQMQLNLRGYLNIDLFAGGGGASDAMEEATGETVDIAINHDDDAISMHIRNHPHTRHYREDLRKVCPREATGGLPVGRLHASPECTHHSQAAGGQPRSVESRSLSWMLIKWAGMTRPIQVTMENVMQILQWGPLIAKRCRETGRVIRLDGTVAAPGERVPVQEQYLVPDPKRKGKTWNRFLQLLRGMGYKIHFDKLVAADFGAATTRARLFLIARRDGIPLNWPEATHAKNPGPGQLPWVPIADCIDWSIPCPSIFLDKEQGKAAGVRRPLVANTMERVRKGVVRYVKEHPDPFMVDSKWVPFITEHANGSRQRNMPSNEPGRTICSEVKGGHFAVVAPALVPASPNQSADGHGTASVAYLAQHNGGYNKTLGRHPEEPATALTTTGSQQNVVTASLVTLRNGCIGRDVREGAPTITAGADDLALLECILSPEHEEGALRVAAFLMGYYGSDNTYDPRDPGATITTRDRLALVTVTIKGSPYVIVDIGMRMLTPRELYLIQGFRPTYEIERGHDGRQFSNKAQVKMCGNSVSPPPYRALLKANPLFPEQAMQEAA